DWLDRGAVVVPANNIGRYGNVPVSTLTGPGTWVFSLTLAKNFSFGQTQRLRFEASAANLFNHLNLGVPNTNIGSSSFGRITSTQTRDQAGPRTLQLSLPYSLLLLGVPGPRPRAPPPPPLTAALRRWQSAPAPVLLAGCAGSYVCRSTLSVAAPLLLADPQAGLDKPGLGAIISAGVLAYAAGKVTNGVLADFLGGRIAFLGGM